MAAKKERFCGDCLHCKVSARSTKNKRLCFCGNKKSPRNHREQFWLAQKPCKAFVDMG
jgi:hypothetical protein